MSNESRISSKSACSIKDMMLAVKLSKFYRDKLHIQARTSESNYLNPVQFALSLLRTYTHEINFIRIKYKFRFTRVKISKIMAI